MIILHGDDQTKSRNALQKIRSEAHDKGKEVVSLDGKSLEVADLIQALEAGSLFGGERLVILENLIGSPTSKRRDQILGYLSQNPSDALVLWEGKAAPAVSLKKLGGVASEFKISSSIFSFVESLAPNNTRSLLLAFDKALEQDPVELVFFMSVRQVRQLIQVVSGRTAFKGPAWLADKLFRQARAFGLEKLLLMHQQLYEMDKKTKTGTSNLDLKTEFELFLMGV